MFQGPSRTAQMQHAPSTKRCSKCIVRALEPGCPRAHSPKPRTPKPLILLPWLSSKPWVLPPHTETVYNGATIQGLFFYKYSSKVTEQGAVSNLNLKIPGPAPHLPERLAGSGGPWLGLAGNWALVRGFYLSYHNRDP